ncbi:lipase family protein [Mycolicibacter hiberniae]|uniref:lipase family protein n=1 Tax=Mycolicibacter hiberniae TaxID=29314 RepID=UPI000A14CC69|nr:lipase family protein [Mycolicibacter hiberniae]ORV70436.1 lipase [Mycolicibacter hiberniae]
MAFSPSNARDVALPLVSAAYAVMAGAEPTLPAGLRQTALILADRAHLAGLPDRHPAAVMARDTDVFGLMGHDTSSATAFIAFRGSADVADWIAGFDYAPTPYTPLAGFGQVHTGFQEIYGCVRGSIAANVAAAISGCGQILITGHSLGAALAVLAAPDVAAAMPPNTIEPRLTTFGGPRVGLDDFKAAFDAAIECCYRVVNFLDIVPLVPPEPFVHVGAGIAVDSGGAVDLGWRHSLAAYRTGLTPLVAAQA